ncbi:MAG TPA: polyprenyl synthetase family protein [Gemmataceae bacterium]|nr:polyprenyl synthetase family protein [Gemmataceae bacterium]
MLNAALANGTRPKPSALPLSLVAGDLSEVDRIYDEALLPFRTRFGPIVQHLRNYRGKRLRPALVLLAGHTCGKVTQAHHVLGAVVEMVHTATLVHDDVLDEANVRRHLPTVNATWGAKTSLLLGDMLFSAAFRLCSTIDAQACAWIGDATNRVCAGELLQVSRAGDLSLSEEDYFEIVAGKTGALTECCTRLGAHYAGATNDVVERMEDYGRDLGVAFQIADDVLDLGGDAFVAGKTLGTDVEQQKLTLPLIRALAELPAVDADRLRMAFRKGMVSDVADALATAGSIESAEAEARRLAQRARRALTPLPSSAFRTALEHVAEWAVKRER